MPRPRKIPVAPIPLVLIHGELESWMGVVGLDDEGNLYECPIGHRSYITSPRELAPEAREQIATAMINRWKAFAAGVSIHR